MPASAKRQRLSPIDSMSLEDRYLSFGGKRPKGFGLHNATTEAGIQARAGIEYLLAQIRMDGTFAGPAKNILQSCAKTHELPLRWLDLMSLDGNYWWATKPLLEYVRRTGGLSRDDFADDGQEFSRLVFGSKPAAGATC